MDRSSAKPKLTGLKATLPRLKILEIFQKQLDKHLTAEDVYRCLLQENSEIGLATVYRVLTQFEQAGILCRHNFDSGKAVYELSDEKHHDHIVCVACGRVEEFLDDSIEARQQEIAEKRGFSIVDHALVIYGHCEKCRAANAGRK